VGIRQRLPEGVADRLLVLGVAVGVKKRDRDRLGLGFGYPGREVSRLLVFEFLERPVRSHPLGGAESELVRGERHRPGRAQPVQLRPVLSAERDQVGEALGGDERRLRTTALEQRVGGDGHAVRELFDVRGARAGLVQGRADRRRHAFGLVLGRGRGLRGDQSAVERENGVGERPAHVDADQHGAST